MFSVIRIYNILIIVTAQYLTSIFILSPNTDIIKIIFDPYLFLIILCSSIAIGSGYIINNFYDEEKDLINRPIKYNIDKAVKKNTKLKFYLFLNFVVIALAFVISYRAIIFFSLYIFFLWLYSHKLKRILFIGNLFYSILTVTPFFAILLYYKNIDLIIVAYALFLFFIILLKDITKDLKNLVGDFSLNYQTIPVVFGEKFTKAIITLITTVNIILVLNLYLNFNRGLMEIFYFLSIVTLFLFLIKLYKSSNIHDYLFLHNILRFIITIGIISIFLTAL
ncbi:MAG: geranylgeranylglycerol-phosphate geranylgeranyltransferase [Bacteroidota bacterium]|nr:geranylgeranylglycerol-phosphate geranylgeranyltransferase [Bacteroidota bacterium]